MIISFWSLAFLKTTVCIFATHKIFPSFGGKKNRTTMFPGIVNTPVEIWGEKKSFEQRGDPPSS